MRVILFVLAGAVLLEAFIAFIVYPLKSKKKDRKSYYWVARNSIYKFDPVLGHSLRPNLTYSNPTTPIVNAPRKIMNFDIRTDDNGFLFTEDLGALKNRYKLIFCLGDSVMMGSESQHNETCPAALDLLVRERGYRCINASAGGYRSYHQLLLLKNKILPHKPKAVVLYTGWNDFADYVYGYYAPHNQFRSCLSYGLPSNRMEAVLNNSALFHAAKKMLYAAAGKIREEALAVGMKEKFSEAVKSGAWMKEWKENIRRIVDLCGESGITCHIISVMAPVYRNAAAEAKKAAEAELNMGGCFDAYVDFLDAANDSMIALCEENGVNFIDARPGFEAYCRTKENSVDYRKRFLLFVDRCHLTKEGNDLFARLVYEGISKYL